MDTRELIRKGFYAGIGVLSLTREKAWALADGADLDLLAALPAPISSEDAIEA